MIYFTGSASFSQMRMKNRSAWKSSSTETTSQPESPSSSGSTAGYSEPDTAKNLSEVVITATRTEKKLDEVGRSVSVITADDIKRSGANSLAEILSLSEGIYITGTQQNFGANQSLFMRGANSNQSVVMIDGVTLSDPSTPGGALDISELSLSDIDRIEIVRGSHSTLFGSSAIGGVINIITTKKQKQGLNINATGTAGSFGKETSLVSENIGVNYTCKGGFYTTLNFLNADITGMDATVDTTNGTGMPRDKDNMNRFDYGGKLGYRNSKLDVHVNLRQTEKKADLDAKEFTDDDNYTLDFTRKWFSYGASYKVDSGFTVALNGGHSTMVRHSLNDSSLIDNMGHYDQKYYEETNTGETFSNEVQFRFSQKKFDLIIGGGMNDQLMNQKYYSYWSGFVYEGDLDSLKLASRTNSFFILTNLNGSIISEKAKNFSLMLGVRNNKNNTFGNSITYQVNPMLKIAKHSTLYANISTGYNAPSLYQLYSPDIFDSITRGNVNLRPETSVTNEVGIYQNLGDNTGMRLGYFQTYVKDVIEYVYLWNGNVPVSQLNPWTDYRGDTYMNLGELRTEGIEMEAHGAIGNHFMITGTFTYLRGRQINSWESVDTVKSKGNHVQLQSSGQFVDYTDVRTEGLTRRPVTANLAFQYSPCSGFFLKAIVKYVSAKQDVLGRPDGTLGRVTVNAYTLTDVIAGMRFNQNISSVIRVENLFNVKYSEIRGYASRGRGLYFSVNYTF